MDYLIVNEVTLPRLLWGAVLGRPICVVEARSILQNGGGFVSRVVSRLRAAGRIKTLADFPDLSPFADAGDFQRLTNVFAESEAWMEQALDFPTTDARFGRYGLAFRHIACNEAFRRYSRAYLMNACAERGGLAGLDAFDAAFLAHRFGTGTYRADVCRLASRILGFAVFALATVKTVAWVLSRIRLRPPPPAPVFLASDYQGGERDSLLWREICDDPRQVMVVFRDAQSRAESAARVAEFPSCMPTDGVFGVTEGLRNAVSAAADCARLYAAGWTLPADFLRPLVSLPWKRMVYRALFHRFRPKYYWGRDDYNVDHVMRSQELRRVGGVSMGIMHGLPSIVPFSHQMRHLDFDLYYVHSLRQFEQHYSRCWPSAMRVRSVGSVGLDRDEMMRLAEPCPNYVAVILGPSFHEDAVFAAVAELAQALPERTIWVNTKNTYRDRGTFGAKFQSLVAHGPANVREFRGRTYDLFFKARYWLSESSTLIAEAVQFGRVGFCLDPDDRFKFLYYRQFPRLIVRGGAEVAARIKTLEEGEGSYPRSAFAPLIRLDGQVCWDVIRQDMGLAPRQPQANAHLAFVGATSSENR